MALPDDAPLSFEAQRKPLKRLRWYLYGAVALGLLPTLLARPVGVSLVVSVGVMLLVVLLTEWMLRKAPRPGEAAFTLTREAIESPGLQGATKRYRWADIDSVEVNTVQGVPMLQLRLRSHLGLPDRRQFFNGHNPSRPVASLQPLAPADREALLDAIAARLRPPGMALLDSAPAPSPSGANPLREAREWQERLQALAPRTWVSWGLIGLNLLVWLAMLAAGAPLMGSDVAMLYAWGGNASSAVQAGEWWRLLSAAFLHAGLMHLAFNMLGLFTIGPLLERIYGHAQFLLIYLVSALAGSVASLHVSAQTKVSVGASGAVFGIAGALIVGVYQHRASLPRHFSRPLLTGMLPFLGYSLLMGFTQSNIDNAAHLGGLLGGALVALALPERFDPAEYLRQRLPRSALVLLAAALALPWLAGQASPAAVNVGAQLRVVQEWPEIAQEFDAAMQALRQESDEVKAGRLSQLQADEASRQVHAPRFARIVGRLEQAVPHLPARAGDIGRELLNVSRAFHESLAMDSQMVDGKPVPVDPARAQALQQQIRASAERIAALRQAQRR